MLIFLVYNNYFELHSDVGKNTTYFLSSQWEIVIKKDSFLH